jgi:hypothetical protein
MTSIIRIKRSGTTAAPSALASGELAYSWENSTGGKLYIGWGNENGEGEAQNVSAIGGLYYTDLVTDRISHTAGTLTANGAIIVDSDSKIDQLKIDDIVIDANTISTAVANTNLVFVVGGGKSVDVSGAKIINLGEPTANTDAATKFYVDEAISGVESGSEFDYAADTGTGSVNLSTEVFSLFGGTGISTVANSAADSITINLDDTSVVANTYDTTTGVPTFTVDAQGRLTAASTSTTLAGMTQVDIGDLSISGNTISSTDTNGNINFNPDGTGSVRVVSSTTQELGSSSVKTFDVVDTADASLFTVFENGNLTISGDLNVGGTGNSNFAGNVRVEGDLILVQGNTEIGLSLVGDALDLAGDLVVEGNTTLGNEATDTVTITGIVDITGSLDVDNIKIDGNTISSTSGDIVFDPFTGSIDISGAVITNSGSPTANSDLTTKEYVDLAVSQASSNADLDIAGDSGTGTINLLTETLTVAGGTGLSTSVTDNTITVNLDNTGVVANTYGSSTEIPVLTINEQGQITLANTASISTDLSISGDSGTDTISLLTDTLNVAGGTGVTTSVANNQVEISIGQDVSTTANVTFENVVATNSLEAGDVLISGNTISTTSNTGLVLDASFISVNDTLIKDVADPETAGDAANKRYVDEVAQGLKTRQAAWVLTDSNLSANYDPDGYEIGWATLTSTSNGAFPDIDGVLSATLNVVGARILVIGQTNKAHNGLYVVSTVGDVSNPWILRRCGSCRTSEQIPSSFVFVQQGTIYESTGWVAIVNDVDTFVVGVDDITWTQFSGAGTFIAGNGLDLTGNVFSVNVDGLSIEIVADTLQVANNGITNDMLAGSIENGKLVNSSISFAANTGTVDPVSLGETITFAGNTGVTTTVSNNEIVISGTFATDTDVGVASFSNTDFIVTNGLVEILPESIQDTVATFIIGGQSITTSYDDANNALTIAADVASLTNIGVASFGGWADGAETVRQFAVSGGDVSIAAIDGGTF